jgi:MOSC domain-containing protein YiiM
VSLLPVEDIDEMKKVIPDLKPGDFAENITTQGIDLDHIKIGDRIIVGEDIVLEVSQIGKECHSGCEIQKLTGECIMPTKGVFTKVLKGGIVKRDDSLRVQMLSGQKFIE